MHAASMLLHASPQKTSEPAGLDSCFDQRLLQHRLASLHGTEDALVTTSRSSALSLLLTATMKPGDNLVCADQISGESYRFMSLICPRLAFDVRFVSRPWELERWEERMDERTQLLFVECPSDPNMFIPDLTPLSALAHDHCIPLLVDNTVATGALCRPGEWGADLTLTSMSGDLTGQMSLAVGGALLGSSAQIDVVRAIHGQSLAPLSPFSTAFALLGLETLLDRMATKKANTMAIRSYLLEKRAEGEVTFVNHPSLRKHPQHELARQYLYGFSGALISFGLPGDSEAAQTFVGNLHMIAPATHPGSSRSTIAHPYGSTHAELTPDQKIRAVIQPNVLRLCVGNEDPGDIIEDLERAFSAI